MVATPIGNLGDLSPRAVETLRAVRLILAEDTRQVRKLLVHFGIPTPTQAFHEHNEGQAVPGLLVRLGSGEDLALVSDAGTPLLSDPGFRLVRACRERGVEVLAVPGPSAVVAAVAVSGLPPYPFTFAGFLPPRQGARERALEAFAGMPHTLVLFLSPHRLAEELASCAKVLGSVREGALTSELSKVHERCRRGTLAELATWASTAPAPGEHTLVIGPPVAAATTMVDRETAERALGEALKDGLALGPARQEAARRLGISRRQLYALLQGAGPGSEEPC
ncbi:MAG: 16S rRNA (cytidine(1402)-2'-O)-methyltransferase [Thermoanaerobaculaceae bacterium]|nr:16S rRNA (cytidine(1402)-2'-O)-methyltransferase [Thermoanaerobaculaceae bacterium]